MAIEFFDERMMVLNGRWCIRFGLNHREYVTGWPMQECTVSGNINRINISLLDDKLVEPGVHERSIRRLKDEKQVNEL